MRLSFRLLSSVVQRRPFYITTPIFYVNAEPHIGHLYTAVLADAVQRFEKLTNPHFNVIFSTGTDEHGSKIQQAAAAANTPPQQYCDAVSEQYRQLFQEYSVQYTHFVRTTDERHKEAVTHFWNELVSRDAVYKARYSGWYSVPDESFVPAAQLAEVTRGGRTIKVSAESGHPVEWTEEENYMFRLSAFREHLQEWLRTEGVVVPGKFQAAVLHSALGAYLPDISISRPSSRVHWAIRVPGDPSQSIYVWVDALVSYLTSAGYPALDELRRAGRPWPADLQLVGKDILKFHAIYWPALLMATGLPPPRRLLAHAHWTRDGTKMSKSLGNVLRPRELRDAAGGCSDAVRYVLLREATLADDANFSLAKFVNICNSELADSLGNLLSRSLALCRLARTPPSRSHTSERPELLDLVEQLADTCHAHYTNFQLHRSADAAVKCLHAANAYFDRAKPWLLRDQGHEAQLHNVLHVVFETLRVTSIVLQPLIPNLTDRLLTKLGVGVSERSWEHARPQWDANESERPLSVGEKFVLFPRILKEKTEVKEKNTPKQKKKKKDLA